MPKVCVYMKSKPVILQCWLQRCAGLVSKTEQIHTFSCFISKLRGILKKAKKSRPAAFGLIFSLRLLNSAVPAFKIFSQHHIKHLLAYRYQFFVLYFIEVLILCHSYYSLGVMAFMYPESLMYLSYRNFGHNTVKT